MAASDPGAEKANTGDNDALDLGEDYEDDEEEDDGEEAVLGQGKAKVGEALMPK